MSVLWFLIFWGWAGKWVKKTQEPRPKTQELGSRIKGTATSGARTFGPHRGAPGRRSERPHTSPAPNSHHRASYREGTCEHTKNDGVEEVGRGCVSAKVRASRKKNSASTKPVISVIALHGRTAANGGHPRGVGAGGRSLASAKTSPAMIWRHAVSAGRV